MYTRFLSKYYDYLLETCLILMLSGITTPAFADNDKKTPGYSQVFNICLDNSEGITSRMMDCTGAEQEYQDWRLNTAYQVLMKTLSLEKQKKRKQEERDWIKKRESTCAQPEDSGSLGEINYSGCFLEETTKQANMLETLLRNTSE